MTTATLSREGLDAIENASRDEIAGAPAQAHEVVGAARLRELALLPQALRRPRRPSGRPPTSPTSRSSPSPSSRTCATPIRSACSPCRASSSPASTAPPAPPASRPSSATPRATSTPGPTSIARSIRASGGRPGDICHVAYGYGLFTGGLGAHYGAERLGCTVVPISGGMTERQVTLIDDFKPADHHGDALLHAVDPGRVPPPRPRPARELAQGRHLRRRALDQRHAPGDRDGLRHGRGRHLRPVGDHGPGRRQRVRRDQGRPARLGGPLLSGDHRPGDRRGPARRRDGRARLHHAHQGGRCR